MSDQQKTTQKESSPGFKGMPFAQMMGQGGNCMEMMAQMMGQGSDCKDMMSQMMGQSGDCKDMMSQMMGKSEAGCGCTEATPSCCAEQTEAEAGATEATSQA